MMYAYDQIEFHHKKNKFLHGLPLEEFRENWITLTDEIRQRHESYLADALSYAKENADYILEDRESPYNKWWIVYEDGIKEEVAAILLCDLKTKKGMLKALANEIKVSTVLWRVGRPSYEQRRDMFFKCLSYLTNDEKHILSAALASAKTPFDYYDLESTQPELYKAYKMLNEDDASDRPDDYLYRKLWNDKVYHNVFTEKEQDKIFKRLLPYVSEEQFREIRGAAADIFSWQQVNDLLAKVKEYRKKKQ